MKVAVIGAGAMGCLYGGMLAESGNDVWLIDVSKDHVDAINKEGLHIEGIRGKKRNIKNIKATTCPDEVGIVDCALIFVKSIHTHKAILQNKTVIGKNTIILTLQNGLGNTEKINQVVQKKNIMAGTTAHGATMVASGRIKHAGQGKTVIGEIDGKNTDRIEKIKKILIDAQIDTEISSNIMGLIWDKLLVNVGINALTAITGLKNGELVELAETEWILEELIKEAQMVAKAKGIKLGCKDPVDHTKKVCKATAQNLSSMLQDVEHKRETEIDMMNGAIVKEGLKLQIPTPINQVITHLIKVKTRY